MVLVSLAVLYNLIFVLGRAVFWELNNAVPQLWWFLDYTCDTIYLLDSIIHAHEGKYTPDYNFLLFFFLLLLFRRHRGEGR